MFGFKDGTLPKKTVERVEQANSLIKFFVRLLTAVGKQGKAGVLKNPLNAYLWPILKELQALQDWTVTTYAACA